MKLRTVGELKQYLSLQSLSPEKFSSLCGISNMTVRRWIKNPDSTGLPSKYWPIFDHAFLKESATLGSAGAAEIFNFSDGFADLEKHVHAMGEKAPSAETLQKDYSEKSKDLSIARALVDKVKFLFEVLVSKNISAYQRTLVLGAIAYFISPFDLVPDVTPIIGYLDDYAVVSMVIASVGHGFRRDFPTES